ncbi:MAG: ATP-binding protein [Elusimicrobiota bacterium]|jgi:predicted AAA+ superfamily ATPase|nr:ATP-binding protein [Elusimicrobiota bacterium]
MLNLIDRPQYLEKLKAWKDKSDLIKVVTGIRRCGKSTLFKLFQNHLKETGVKDKQILDINLEEAENEDLLDYKKLHNFVEKNISKNKKNYVFIDEIQLVSDFPKTINSLRLKENIDLYVTGSNAYMFTPKIITLLSGRFTEIKMNTLSFKEYSFAFKDEKDLSKLYENYISDGSFPQILKLSEDKQLIQDYLVGLYNTIIQKDIVLRGEYKDISRLESVVKFIFDNIGNETSVRNISNSLFSDGRKIHPQTIESYLQGLLDSFLIYKAQRYNIKGKQHLQSNAKYYVADIGLRRALLGTREADKSQILENIVYLELLRRGYRVEVGKIGVQEIDFIASLPGGRVEYYQVSQNVLDEKTLKRELAPLKAVDDNYPKFLLTRDYDNAIYNGIKQINVLQWLMD